MNKTNASYSDSTPSQHAVILHCPWSPCPGAREGSHPTFKHRSFTPFALLSQHHPHALLSGRICPGPSEYKIVHRIVAARPRRAGDPHNSNPSSTTSLAESRETTLCVALSCLCAYIEIRKAGQGYISSWRAISAPPQPHLPGPRGPPVVTQTSVCLTSMLLASVMLSLSTRQHVLLHITMLGDPPLRNKSGPAVEGARAIHQRWSTKPL
jgi:hypothetical protein